jgi:signal peptidase II
MLIYLLMFSAFAADRLSKWWAASYLSAGDSIELHPLIRLHPTYNSGIAFGMFEGIGPLVGWITIGVLIGMFLYLRRVPRTMWALRMGLALVIGGALGNLVDRITAGEVLDFITTPVRPGIFNVADVMIYSGVALSIIGLFFQRPPEEVIRVPITEQDRDQMTQSDL